MAHADPSDLQPPAAQNHWSPTSKHHLYLNLKKKLRTFNTKLLADKDMLQHQQSEWPNSLPSETQVVGLNRIVLEIRVVIFSDG